MRAAGPVVVVDAGNALLPPEGEPDAQRRAKAEAMVEAFALAGIDGAALGATDWRLGRDEVLALYAKHAVPALAANLTCAGAAPLPSGRVVERPGWKVGIVGVTEGPVEGCEVGDPVAAAEAAFARLGPVDVRVLLLPGPAEAFPAAAARPVADLIVDGGTGRHLPGAMALEQSVLVASGSRGKQLGVTTLERVPGRTGWAVPSGADDLEARIGQLRARIERVRDRATNPESNDKSRALFQGQLERYQEQLAGLEAEQARAADAAGERNGVRGEVKDLDGGIPDHAATAALVARALGVATADERAAAVVVAGRVGPEGSTFAGSDACVSCHPAQSAQWAGTRHAAAWSSLERDGRALDAECYACHATGVGEGTGPSRPAEVGGLRDVQCEACHGASRAHAASPAEVRTRLPDPPEVTCTRCHDGVRDEGRFDFSTYRPRVVHGSP